MPRHSSVPVYSSVELVNIEPSEHSPLVSKCIIKVCYVGDEPNRNGSIITKETATKMASSLRGAIIAGYYNSEKKDFEGHNQSIEIGGGEFKIKDLTRPYGFVDIHADVWFQKFIDDGEIEHEYLCTTGWLWTKTYEECQRVIDKGNNQSMELASDYIEGSWTRNGKDQPEFFIINEAVVEKLTILGEEVEPCFEGSSIGTDFSLGADFKEQVFSMLAEIKEILTEGGEKSMEQTTPETVVEQVEKVTSDEELFKKKDEEEEKETEQQEQEDSSEEEEKKDDENAKAEEDDEEEKKKKNSKHELQEQYDELNQRFAALEQEKLALEEELKQLREFKQGVERVKKQEMIDSFFMLSNEDKADVQTNIDTYSLDDIEAKLSVICVRNKVNLNPINEKEEETPKVFNLESERTEEPEVPDWIKALNAVVAENNF